MLESVISFLWQSASIPHLVELNRLKNQTVQLGSWPMQACGYFKILSILEGKFEWQIEQTTYQLYPHDVLVLSPWHSLGHAEATLEIGSFQWVSLQPELIQKDGTIILGEWSDLNENEQRLLGKLFCQGPLLIQNQKIINDLIFKLEHESKHSSFGFLTRINHLLDEMLIVIFRQASQQQHKRHDFSQAFGELEKLLRNSLDHPWTVEEMAAIVGMGTTAFTEKVKAYSGFSPLNYLINIRVAEAMRQLRQTDKSLTDIALDMGFYSSQHFSTTFKKLTGYTPGQYRKASPPPRESY
ncbi:MAG: helix-turn-helix domain-containing protein [Runella sp.]